MDSSFSFLLHKPRIIPRWILERDDLFAHFLAGYFDAEGSISFDLREHNKSIGLIVKSCDYGILDGIARRLMRLSFAPRFGLVLKAGQNRLRQDFWRVQISNRSRAIALLRALPLRHPEKVAKAHLAYHIASTNWVLGWDSFRALQSQIKDEVRQFKSQAEDALSSSSHTPSR